MALTRMRVLSAAASLPLLLLPLHSVHAQGASSGSFSGSSSSGTSGAAGPLGLGFEPTMPALMPSAVLVAVPQRVQAKEDSAANHAGEKTLGNLITRLDVERKS